MSSIAGNAGGLAFAGAAAAIVVVRAARGGGRFGARLLISTTCNFVTLAGRLSGMLRSPRPVDNWAVTLGEATEPAIAALPEPVSTASSRPRIRKLLRVAVR